MMTHGLSWWLVLTHGGVLLLMMQGEPVIYDDSQFVVVTHDDSRWRAAPNVAGRAGTS